MAGYLYKENSLISGSSLKEYVACHLSSKVTLAFPSSKGNRVYRHWSAQAPSLFPRWNSKKNTKCMEYGFKSWTKKAVSSLYGAILANIKTIALFHAITTCLLEAKLNFHAGVRLQGAAGRLLQS
ncbi:uncharacterized protein MCYG_06559 [Microsporum canis CBS 113480]|uniref:Uncharacterized protein n=1 Tax=Arthroderma otae (strain ATCC MYA-4605 / CBS 113480) TaxID=554155 RepID=C5FV06_ARTOC|nr:uncharacterized protein MCYG_06559 [Microsporum canis CBS 113480]EEQ33740.1 predicted protein [Microsporum canis CBS 113480]